MKEAHLKGNWLKRHKGIITVLAIVLIATIVMVVILSRKNQGSVSEGGFIKQNTISLSKMDLANSVSATGTIESAVTENVSADVSNLKVKSIKVSEGEDVTEGQTLLEFDQEQLKENLEQAQENLSDAQTQVDNELSQAQRQLSTARSTYSSQSETLSKSVANAKKEWQSAKKEVSKIQAQIKKAKGQEKEQLQTQLEQAKSAVSQKKASYEQAVNERKNSNQQNQNSIETAKNAVSKAQTDGNKTLREARRSVEEAQEAIENCKVTATMSGTVTGIGVSQGDVYSGGTLFEISDCSQLQVSTSVSEYDITKLEQGQRVVILTEATDEDEIQGEISYVAKTTGSSSLSAGNNGSAGASGGNSTDSTGSYAVTIKITQTDERILVGMTAKCSIVLEEASDVFAVPYDAIHTNRNGESVIYVIDSEQTTSSEETSAPERDDREMGQEERPDHEIGQEEQTDQEMGQDGRGKPGEQDTEDSENSETRRNRGDRPGFSSSDGNGKGDATEAEQSESTSANQREIVVTKGLESDYYVEISGDELKEGMQVVIPSDETTKSSDSDSSSEKNVFSNFPGMGNDRGGSGFSGGGGMRGGDAPGGGPGR